MKEVCIADLQKRFGSENVTFFAGPADLPAIKLANAFGEAEICVYAAHVMSYKRPGEEPVLWMSQKSMFTVGEPIRGGVPICWPWFGPHAEGKFGGHGYARLAMWDVIDAVQSPNGETSVTLQLTEKDVDPKFAPAPFRLEFTVTLGSSLVMALKVYNTGDADLTYSGALHSYFNVADSAAIKVEGLSDCKYLDKVVGTEGVQSGDIVIDREIDRVFCRTSGICRVIDPGFGRVIRVAKSGSSSTVVWNPWIEKSKKMPDFGDEEYHTMVCVEAANVPAADDARTLAPGAMGELRQIISVE